MSISKNTKSLYTRSRFMLTSVTNVVYHLKLIFVLSIISTLNQKVYKNVKFLKHIALKRQFFQRCCF